jgi:hypothetical protein
LTDFEKAPPKWYSMVFKFNNYGCEYGYGYCPCKYPTDIVLLLSTNGDYPSFLADYLTFPIRII